MYCKSPFKRGMQDLPCGACMPCRIGKQRQWRNRMLLEQHEYGPFDCSFVTLTYNDEHNPITLVPKQLADFIKRLRNNMHPRKIRFYAVGEYGEQSWRPHYHLIIFGLPMAEAENILGKSWPYGFIQVGTVTPQSISYTCGYLLKRMTKDSDPRLMGKHPEFSRHSIRPGLGYAYVERVKTAYQTWPGQKAYHSITVPPILPRLNGKLSALPQNLRTRILDTLAVSNHQRKSEITRKFYEELEQKNSLGEVHYKQRKLARQQQQTNPINRRHL